MPALPESLNKKKVSLASVLGSAFFGQDAEVALELAEPLSSMRIEGFAEELGVELLSYSDARDAEPFFSPSLEHGSEIQIVDLSAPTIWDGSDSCFVTAGRANADGAIIIVPSQGQGSAQVESQDRALPPRAVRVGMRTADCLTWVCCLQAGPKTVVGLAHLGWRGFTAALHWRMAREMLRLCQGDEAGWRGARHYLSPSVFAEDYPCDDRDVGAAIRNLDALVARLSDGPLLENALRQREAEECTHLRHRLAGFSGTKCYPDLQLLVLADLLCLGAGPERVNLHRVNTARSTAYPSYRHRAAKAFPDGRSRLATVATFELSRRVQTIK